MRWWSGKSFDYKGLCLMASEHIEIEQPMSNHCWQQVGEVWRSLGQIEYEAGCFLGLPGAKRYHLRVNVRFYIDPETGEPHIYSHAIAEDEVEEILRYPGDDMPGRQDSRIALGQTQAGRYLQVVYVPDADRRGLFVVTAYDLRGKALASYRRRRKRKR